MSTYRAARLGRRGRIGRLGDVCTIVGAARVCSPSPSVLTRGPFFGQSPQQAYSQCLISNAGPNVSAICAPLKPGAPLPAPANASTGGMSIAQLTQIAINSPGYLTGGQIAALQAAGVIPTSAKTAAQISAYFAAVGYSNLPAGLTASTPVTAPSAYSLSNPDPQCVAAGMTGGPYPNCAPANGMYTPTVASTFSLTDPTTWPWYLWLGGAAGIYFLFIRR
jgi:hypothetical protein